MNKFLQKIFQGRYEVIDDSPNYGSDVIEVLVDALLVEPYDEAALEIFLRGLAISMTNTLRSGSWSEGVDGTSYSLESYVKVDWIWIVLPATLVLLSIPFLIATIVQSYQARIEPWKTSTLAVLQSLDGELRSGLGALQKESTMKKRAEACHVQLKEGNDGWRLA